jgi:hypothetical protein
MTSIPTGRPGDPHHDRRDYYQCCGETYAAGDARLDSSIDPIEAQAMTDATCPFCGDEGRSLESLWEAQQEEAAAHPPLTASEQHANAWALKQKLKGR